MYSATQYEKRIFRAQKIFLPPTSGPDKFSHPLVMHPVKQDKKSFYKRFLRISLPWLDLKDIE